MEDLGSGAVGGQVDDAPAVRTKARWRLALVLAATVALLCFAAERGLRWQDERAQGEDRNRAVVAAKAEVERLIGINAATSDADLDALLSGATADFRDDLEAQAAEIKKALADNEVTATGDVVSVGVLKISSSQAAVIVAATGTVANTQSKESEPRNYRLRVDLQKRSDQWLVSGLEFVA